MSNHGGRWATAGQLVLGGGMAIRQALMSAGSVAAKPFKFISHQVGKAVTKRSNSKTQKVK